MPINYVSGSVNIGSRTFQSEVSEIKIWELSAYTQHVKPEIGSDHERNENKEKRSHEMVQY